MLGKAFGLMRKQKKTADPSTGAGGKSKKRLGDISKMLNASGRISLQMLQKISKVYTELEFERFMQQPVLVGSSIQAGSLATHNRHAKDELNKTVIFELNADDTGSGSSDSLQHAIYPLVKDHAGLRYFQAACHHRNKAGHLSPSRRRLNQWHHHQRQTVG
jgi:hypothetical protein